MVNRELPKQNPLNEQRQHEEHEQRGEEEEVPLSDYLQIQPMCKSGFVAQCLNYLVDDKVVYLCSNLQLIYIVHR